MSHNNSTHLRESAKAVDRYSSQNQIKKMDHYFPETAASGTDDHNNIFPAYSKLPTIDRHLERQLDRRNYLIEQTKINLQKKMYNSIQAVT